MTIDTKHPTIIKVDSLPARQPGGNYVPYRKIGSLVYLSGQTSSQADGTKYVGQIGKDLSIEDGYAAAQICMENLLAVLKQAVDGDWSRVVSCVRLTGYVNSQAPFGDGPKVINGASDLIVQIMGQDGHHARSAVGVSALPANTAVEVEAIFEIR